MGLSNNLLYTREHQYTFEMKMTRGYSYTDQTEWNVRNLINSTAAAPIFFPTKSQCMLNNLTVEYVRLVHARVLTC